MFILLCRNGQLTLWDCNTDLKELHKLDKQLATKMKEIVLNDDEDDIQVTLDDNEKSLALGMFWEHFDQLLDTFTCLRYAHVMLLFL